jgi:hypothetical protein
MRQFFFMALALLALSFAACGDDDDDDDAESESEASDEDSDDSADAETAGGDPADLVGQWESANLVAFTIQDDETWSMTGPAGGDTIEGTYTATADEISLLVTEECSQDAVYTWTIEEDVLRLNPVDITGCEVLGRWIADDEPWTLETS